MRSREEIWRLRLWVWLPALLFFLANATAFVIYLGFADRVAALENDLETKRQQLTPKAGERQRLERLIQRSQRNEQEIRRLYDERFSTRSARLTRVHSEFRQLARTAGLDPRAITYDEEEIEDFGLIKRTFSFSVAGTYVELRRFINLLELSESFLTLEEVTLAGEESEEAGPELRMRLAISTLFAREPGWEPAPARNVARSAS